MSLGLKRGMVRLVRYDPGWAVAFARERTQLLQVLGPAAVAIEHVGSTAVEGLLAKPILDIAVAGRPPIHAAEWQPRLERLGYAAFGDRESRGDFFFAKGPDEGRTVYLHVVPGGSVWWLDYLAFRDRLRADAALRDAYTELKTGLAEQFSGDRRSYTEAKAAFIAKLIGR
jgi:GrpB-like predicted nucleotidyltransferase (UPF0157 family)